jgi:thioredoxin 1
MEPLLDELSKDLAGKALIAKVNVDENPSLAAQFGVRNLPTFLVFKNGKPVEKIVGAAPKSVLEKRLLAQGDTVSL